MSGRRKALARMGFNPPKATVSQARAAARLYKRFSGHDADEAINVELPKVPKAAVLVGTVDALCYTTVRDGETESYIHEFAEHAKPAFVVSHDGKQLMLLGGRFRFGARGIVDTKK